MLKISVLSLFLILPAVVAASDRNDGESPEIPEISSGRYFSSQILADKSQPSERRSSLRAVIPRLVGGGALAAGMAGTVAWIVRKLVWRFLELLKTKRMEEQEKKYGSLILQEQLKLDAACFAGNVDFIKNCILAGASVEVAPGVIDDWLTRSPFEAALDGGHLEVVQTLVERNLKLSFSHLMSAIQKGKTDIVRYIVQDELSLNPEEVLKLRGFWDPINPDVKEVLIKNVFNKVEQDGGSALTFLSSSKNYSGLMNLLDMGADVNAGNPLLEALSSCELLDTARQLNGGCEKYFFIASFLVNRGADIFLVSKNETAFQKAIDLTKKGVGEPAFAVIKNWVLKNYLVTDVIDEVLSLGEVLSKAKPTNDQSQQQNKNIPSSEVDPKETNVKLDRLYEKLTTLEQRRNLQRSAFGADKLSLQLDLEVACRNQDVQKVTALLEAGAKPEVSLGEIDDWIDKSPFQAAVYEKKPTRVEVLRALVTSRLALTDSPPGLCGYAQGLRCCGICSRSRKHLWSRQDFIH